MSGNDFRTSFNMCDLLIELNAFFTSDFRITQPGLDSVEVVCDGLGVLNHLSWKLHAVRETGSLQMTL